MRINKTKLPEKISTYYFLVVFFSLKNLAGVVSCIPPCSHDAKCQADYSRWPFDTQNCTLHVGTWVNSGEEIDFKVLKTVISENDRDSQSRSWRMVQATYRRNPGNFSESKSTYPSITFSFSIERHSAAYAALILGPAIGNNSQFSRTIFFFTHHN